MGIIKKFRIKSFKDKKPIIKLENISLSFKNRNVLENISFNLNQGQILGLLGPNGVGKSTLFNLITGALKPNHGSIIIGGEDVINYPIASRTKKFKIGYVPQYGGYFHDLTLLDNLKAIGEIQIPNLKDRNSKIEAIISQFELDAVTRVPAKFLSGGERKKLTIALALLGSPKVLLLDEPFAALDVLTIKMLKELIVNLQTQSNLSVVICDHQARDLLSCCDVAIILSNCKVIAKGTPSELVKNKTAQEKYFGNSFRLS